jgi:hypothetical protein
MTMQDRPRLIDNDAGEITVSINGKEMRGWSYQNDSERRLKMLSAREFVEGWYEGYSAGLQRAGDMLEER